MKNYGSFLFKTTLRNKVNLAPLGLLLCLSIFLLTMNTQQDKFSGFTGTLAVEINESEKQLADYQNYLKEEMSDTNFREISAAMTDLEISLEKNKQALAFANQENWRAALNAKAEVLETYDIPLNTSGDHIPQSYYDTLTNKLISYRYLIKHQLKPNTELEETQGFPFVLRIMSSLFPSVFIAAIIMLLTTSFTATFKQGIDLDHLFPISRLKLISSKLIFGLMISLACYSLTLISAFIMASIVNGPSSPLYPLIITGEIVPIGNIILKALILQILCLCLTVLIVYLIAIMSKNKLITSFGSLIIIVGTVLSISEVNVFNSILHLLPMTYFKTIPVLIDEVSRTTGNQAINFQQGIVTLGGSIICCLMIVSWLTYRKK